MTIYKTLLIAMLSVLLTGCGVLNYFMIEESEVSSPPSQSITDDEPPMLHVMQGDVAVPMDRGSYCWTSADVAMCADMMPPSYQPEQHTAVVGGTLELLFDQPFPDTISVSLHPGSNLMTRIADIPAEATIDENGRVQVTLPADVTGDHILVVFATWDRENGATGDASYMLPISIQ